MHVPNRPSINRNGKWTAEMEERHVRKKFLKKAGE